MSDFSYVAHELKNTSANASAVPEIPLVPWFPIKMEEIDSMGKRFMTVGEGIEDTDHPSFRDMEYRKRRLVIAEASKTYKMSDPVISDIQYTDDEHSVWANVYPRLKKLYKANACDEYNWAFDQFEKHAGYSDHLIPQLEPISKYLKS